MEVHLLAFGTMGRFLEKEYSSKRAVLVG